MDLDFATCSSDNDYLSNSPMRASTEKWAAHSFFIILSEHLESSGRAP